MNKNFSTTSLVTITFFLIAFISASAQDYATKPLLEYLGDYKEKHLAISKYLEEHQEFSFTKKLAIFEKRIGELKENFRAERKSEYDVKSVRRAKRHKCVGTTIRGVTNCDAVYLKPPTSDMYTQKDWIKVEGSDKAEVTIEDDSTVSLRLSSTSTRVNKAVMYVTYKYKQENISKILDKETETLFEEVMHK